MQSLADVRHIQYMLGDRYSHIYLFRYDDITKYGNKSPHTPENITENTVINTIT